MNPSLVTVIFLLLLAVYQVIQFAYFHKVFADEMTCEEIPRDSVVLALAFEHLGEKNGVITPGEANMEIVEQLEKCTDRFSLILTQKAVSDAMIRLGKVQNGLFMGTVKLEQMHEHHPKQRIRTLKALQLAIRKLDPLPPALILVAHDKQIERALMDLRILYDGNIILWKHNRYAYARKGILQPILWAYREICIARPIEGIQRIFIKK
jgi:hypothetical protein